MSPESPAVRPESPAGVAHTVTVTGDGPVLLPGPVDLVLPDGRRVHSDRPVTALCVCRRSRRYPFCDTSHRTRIHAGDQR